VSFNADDKVIELKEVESMIGKVGFETLANFAGLLLEGKTEHAITRLSEIADEGHNLAQFAKDLITYVRRAAVLKFSPPMEKTLAHDMTADHLKRLSTQAQLFQDKHIELLKLLIRAHSQMRYSQFPIIALEVAIIEGLKGLVTAASR
jgi:DNA polymerase-3 subunit gamma/tau